MIRTLEILLATLVVAVAFTPAYAQEGTPARAEVSFPAGKTFRVGRPFPVRVALESQSSEMNGRLELCAGNLTWRKSLALPAGGFQVVEFPVLLTDQAACFELRFVGDSGVTVFDVSKEAGSLRGAPPSRKLVLALGGNVMSEVVSFMERIPAETVLMAADRAPDSRTAFEAFDLVTLGPAAWTVMDATRRRALAEYVRFGGGLFVPALGVTRGASALGEYFNIVNRRGPLAWGRWGLGYVITFGEEINFRALSEDRRNLVLARIKDFLVSSGTAYRAPGAIPVVDRRLADMLEHPPRFRRSTSWWRPAFAGYGVILLLLLLSRRAATLKIVVTVVAFTVLVALTIPPASVVADSVISARWCRSNELEFLETRVHSLALLARDERDKIPGETVELASRGRPYPLAGHPWELFEKKATLVQNGSAGVAEFAVSVERPALFLVEQSGALEENLSFESEENKFVFENRTPSDFCACMVTDFKSALPLGPVSRGERVVVETGEWADYQDAVEERFPGEGIEDRTRRRAMEYFRRVRPSSESGGWYLVGYETSPPGTTDNGTEKVDYGRFWVVELNPSDFPGR